MMNPLRKKKVEIEDARAPAPRPEEVGKRWAIEARGIKKSFKAGQVMVDVLKGHRSPDRARRDRARHGTIWLGQVNAARRRVGTDEAR
jgi:hypothetical protein